MDQQLEFPLYKPGYLGCHMLCYLDKIFKTQYYSSIPNGQTHAGIQIRLESRKHDEKFRVMMEVNPFLDHNRISSSIQILNNK